MANGLKAQGWQPGDTVALYLPLSAEAVAVYLGIAKAGLVSVLVADSFSAAELARRMEVTNAVGVIACDGYHYGGKWLNIIDKVREANPQKAIIIKYDENTALQKNEMAYTDFIKQGKFDSTDANAESLLSILFSSGTTKEPKAIPWTHATPIKAGTDAYLHQDVQPGDIVTWTTSMGWMMGPWAIFAALLNKGTLALFDGSPALPAFGEFVEEAQINMLGLIPSLVKVWRQKRQHGRFRLVVGTGV